MIDKLFEGRISIFEVIGGLGAVLIGYYHDIFSGLIIAICTLIIHVTYTKTYIKN